VTTLDDQDLDEALLTVREAAALLRLSERTLERHRVAGTGPAYIALGRAIRYRRRDLRDWIECNARQSTSQRTQDLAGPGPKSKRAGFCLHDRPSVLPARLRTREDA